jgi:hypothetical protein
VFICGFSLRRYGLASFRGFSGLSRPAIGSAFLFVPQPNPRNPEKAINAETPRGKDAEGKEPRKTRKANREAVCVPCISPVLRSPAEGGRIPRLRLRLCRAVSFAPLRLCVGSTAFFRFQLSAPMMPTAHRPPTHRPPFSVLRPPSSSFCFLLLSLRFLLSPSPVRSLVVPLQWSPPISAFSFPNNRITITFVVPPCRAAAD